MMKQELLKITKHFTRATDIHQLPGGQKESFRCGDLVFKPVHDYEKYNWHTEALDKINFDTVQYSRPVRSYTGNFVEDSYGACRYIEGDFYEGRLMEKLEAARLFNQALKDISQPAQFDKWTDPWADAQKEAWSLSAATQPLADRVAEVLEPLFKRKRKVDLKNQLIHCDPAGNILFNSSGPLVIDFSPGFFPADYSLVCLVTDSIAWHNGRIEDLELLDLEHSVKVQLVLRAVLFRVLTQHFFCPGNTDACMNEYLNFQPLIAWLDENK